MIAWLRLMRAALAPTILWDFLAGLLLAAPAIARAAPPTSGAWRVLDDPFQARFLWPLAALLCAYHGGMILNDWVDRKRDAKDGRRRPLVDGSIPPELGFLAAAALLASSAAISMLVLEDDARELGIILLVAVLVYDLGGPILRAHLGPPLLALCRAISLSLAPVSALGLDGVANAVGPLPVLAYALYFMFLSRLAQREEEGVQGMRGLPFLMMAAVSPFLVLADGLGSMLAIPVWLGLAAWLLVPAWPYRHDYWEPARVQAFVRRGLIAAPLVPAIAILAYPPAYGPAWAIGGLVAAFAALTMAKRMAPE